jgi:LysR family transcriptional regulator, nod-box dependent transcriptional activator
MRFNRFDLNQLVILDALLAERSVTKAAERIFLSQPAMSCALTRLRRYFNDGLVVQAGNSMSLTPMAEAMIGPVHDILLQIDAVTKMKPEFDPKTIARKLRIKASDYVMAVYLGRVVQRCLDEAPNLEFRLEFIDDDSSERLERGEVDFLIAPDFHISADHPSELLFDDTFSCLAWGGNSDIGGSITSEEFFSLGHVAPEWSGGRLLSIVDYALAKHGRALRHEVVVPSFMMVSHFLIGTGRIAVLQTRLAQMLTANAPLRVLRCPVEMPVVKIMAQWHRYQDLDPAIAWFRSVLQREVAELSPLAPLREDSDDEHAEARVVSR